MIVSQDQETIVARCTPSGSGALALLRLSGIDAIKIADAIALIPGNKKLIEQPTHTIHYGWAVDAQRTKIDQVLFLLMRAPSTFTGQDTVEITCHNNPFLIEQIMQQALAAGARLAQEGEFTRRAFSNGKIDLLQAEAINELIHAQTQHALKQSLASLTGSFSHFIASLETELLKALAFCQASFEFIDEEMEFADRIHAILANAMNSIGSIKKTFDQQQQIRQGIKIALIGAVNAGKSSLFNSLLNKNRAIVTPIAGTTRDTLEAGLTVNGNHWTLVDTAGLRHADNIVEQEGIKRSFEQAQLADVILLIFDGARSLVESEKAVYQQLLTEYGHKIIIVTTKSDLPQVPCALIDAHKKIAVSNITKDALSSLQQDIEKKISELFNKLDSPFLLNMRHYNLLVSLEQQLAAIDTMLQPPVQYELVAYHLNDAIAHLAQLTGKTISEAGMDMVFREFCVGK